MERKGFASVDDAARAPLGGRPDTDEDAHERAGYVGSMRAANRSTEASW